MGMEQFDGMDDFHFVDFSAGWFANKNRREVPGGYFTTTRGRQTGSLANGFVDVQHCLWYESALRKIFGYSNVPSAALNSNATGLGLMSADWRGENTQCAIFGNAFYEFDSSGSPTDRTNSQTINTTRPYTIKPHIQGANQYLILGNGEAMFKWAGAGNGLVALSGSPHNYQSFDYSLERWWGVRTGASVFNFVYGSDTTNPESNWNDSGNIFPFKDTVYGVVDVGSWLAVLCRNSIGSITGFGRGSFDKDEAVIPLGSTAHRTLAKGQFRAANGIWTPGFYFVSWFGPVFVTEGRQPVPLAAQITEAWDSTTGVSTDYLDTSVGVWWTNKRLYVFAVPWNGDTQPTRIFVYDPSRDAIWPCPDIINDGTTEWYVKDLTVMRDGNQQEWLYMQDSNGWFYKFDPDEKNFYPNATKTAIKAHAKSKVFDLNGVWDLREPQLHAQAVGDWNLDVFFNFNNEVGDGAQGQVNQADDNDTLTNDFIIGVSALGGKEYIFEEIEVDGYGNFLQVMFKDYEVDESFNIEELILWMKQIRKGSLR